MITIPSSGLWGTIAEYLNLNFGEVHNVGSLEYTFKPTVHLPLTNAWQVVAGEWEESVSPIGGSLDPVTGVATINTTGRWSTTLERIYHQHDVNPSSPVVVSIKIQASMNGTDWVDSTFERSSQISTATANDEPAILTFTSNGFIDIVGTPSYFRVLVKGEEGAASPAETDLALLKVSANIIGHVPD